MTTTKIRKLITYSAICLSLTTAWADLVILKNGDRVTGSIIKKDGNNLVVKSDKFGVITTGWDQVESVKADKPINIVLPDGRTVQGTFETLDGKVEVAAKDAKLSLTPAEVSVLRDDAEQKAFDRLQHPGWGQLWAGTAGLGLAGTSGNAKTVTFTSSD